jgi:aspartate 1-decarboxylase
MLHSKIHRATVTASELHYEGSMGIDRAFLKDTGMVPGQQIHVLNVTTGDRFITYVIEEPEGSRAMAVYGAAAHKAKVSDIVIVLAYAQMEEAEAKRYQPKVLILGPGNEVVSHG